MADESSGSGGASKGTIVAIITAIIGAITTITVAFINKPEAQPVQPKNDPPPVVDNKKDAGEERESEKGNNVPPAPVNKPAQIANIAGHWTSPDGETMEIGQTGSQLTISAVGMSEVGPIAAQGIGRINDRDVSWTLQSNLAGNIVEMDCSARLTSNGSSLQGQCNAMGDRFPFIYNR